VVAKILEDSLEKDEEMDEDGSEENAGNPSCFLGM
jgi:hypothetical protein